MIKAVIREQCSKKGSFHPPYVGTALEGFKKVIHGVEFSHSRSLIPSERLKELRPVINKYGKWHHLCKLDEGVIMLSPADSDH